MKYNRTVYNLNKNMLTYGHDNKDGDRFDEKITAAKNLNFGMNFVSNVCISVTHVKIIRKNTDIHWIAKHFFTLINVKRKKDNSK